MLKKGLAFFFFLLLLTPVSYATAGGPYWTTNGVTFPVVSIQNVGGRIAYVGNGNSILAWTAGPESERSIYAQKFNSEGEPQWGEVAKTGVLICAAVHKRYDVNIVPDGSGGAIIGWMDERETNSLDYVYAQRVSSAGTVMWDTNGKLIAQNNFDKGDLVMTGDNAGMAIFAWEQSNLMDYDIRAQKIDSSGNYLWPDGAPSLNGLGVVEWPGDQIKPVLAGYTPLAGGFGAFVAYESLQPDDRVMVCKLNSLGQKVWGVSGVSVSNWKYQMTPSILHDGQGGVFVALCGYDSTSGYNAIVAQRLSDSGNQLWNRVSPPSTGEVVCLTVGNHPLSNPQIVSDGVGGILVVWNDGRDYASPDFNQMDVRAQRLDSNGYPLFSTSIPLSGVPVCDASGMQLMTLTSGEARDFPTILKTSDNAAIICWNDFRRVPSVKYPDTWQISAGLATWEIDVYAQKLSLTDGSRLWISGGAPVAAAPGTQVMPMICADDSTGAVIAFVTAPHPTIFLSALQRMTDLSTNITSHTPEWGGSGTRLTLSGLTSKEFGSDPKPINGNAVYGGVYNRVLFDTTVIATPDVTWARDSISFNVPVSTTGGHTVKVVAYGQESNPVSFIYSTGTGPGVTEVRFDGVAYAENDYINPLPQISARVVSPYDFTVASIAISIDATSSISVPLTEYDPATKRFTHQLTATEVFTGSLVAGNHEVIIYAADTYGNLGAPYSCRVKVSDSAGGAVVSTPYYPGGGTYFDPSGGASGTSARAAGNVVTIAYTLPRAVNVDFRLYGSAGGVLAGASYTAGAQGAATGYNEITWDGRMPTGELVGTGIYPYQLISGGKLISKGYIVVRHSR